MELRVVDDRGAKDLPADIVTFAGFPEEMRKLLLHVHGMLSQIRFGTVVIVLQDGKVIQVETSEKIRIK